MLGHPWDVQTDQPQEGQPREAVPWLPAAPVEPIVEHEPGHPAGPASPPRRTPRAVVAVLIAVAVAALIGLAAVVGEWAARSAEAEAFVGQVERSEAAMISAMSAVGSVLAQEGASETDLPDGAAQQLRGVADSARQEVAAAAEDIAGQPVQPWHGELLAAREAYLAHSAAWQDYLGRASDDAAAWFADDPEIERTWQDFTASFEAVVPTPDFAALNARVRTIIDGGDAPETGGPTLEALAAFR